MAEALDTIRELVRQHSIHTVEIGVADTYGHLRGKRVPADRFLAGVARSGVNIADAIYVFDPLCEIVDSPLINMGTGYLDMHLTPDLASFRVLPHRPGYGLVFSGAVHEDGTPHALDPRNVLAHQLERVAATGHDAVVATELECYLFTSTWEPFQRHVQYSSLTDALDVEAIVGAMRTALLGAGIPIESSNPEYGPGQLEINFAPADPIRTADNTVLFKTIVKQVAAQHGAHASFMPKPYAEASGSGMHVHTSLSKDGANVFGADGHEPNDVMSKWTSGLLHHARAAQLVGIPTPNGYRRVQPNTFCPTHVHWGEDNRTVMARLTMHAGGANRVEYRCPGADANPYLVIAALLAAGVDGLSGQRALPPMASGDMYADPGASPELPRTIDDAIAAYEDSELAAALGADFSANFVTMCRNEAAVAERHVAASPAEVSTWEFERYREHT